VIIRNIDVEERLWTPLNKELRNILLLAGSNSPPACRPGRDNRRSAGVMTQPLSSSPNPPSALGPYASANRFVLLRAPLSRSGPFEAVVRLGPAAYEQSIAALKESDRLSPAEFLAVDRLWRGMMKNQSPIRSKSVLSPSLAFHFRGRRCPVCPPMSTDRDCAFNRCWAVPRRLS